MHTKTEYLIWDKIVKSAKKKFDSDSYSKKLDGLDPEIFDRLILHIILAYASNESREDTSLNLQNELRHIGFPYPKKVIDKILIDKHEVLGHEIYAAYLVFSMMEDGSSEQEVLGYITNLLENPNLNSTNTTEE